MKRALIIKAMATLMLAMAFAVSASAQTGDNRSAVPYYRFGTTLAEQEAQLATNPLMLDFAAARQRLAGDRYRPIFHYVNPEGSLNDPNGLCYWNGNWHMFYQAYPLLDTRQHWGHTISKDLIHWQDLPLAIYPDPERAVFSGATMVENGRVIAAYYGLGIGEMVATASDPLLLNWEKIGNAPVIAQPTDRNAAGYMTFDPCIWSKDGYYYMISGNSEFTGPGERRRPVEYLFKSKDLKTWEYLHPFVEMDQYSLIGDDRACPYFWPIGTGGKYILNQFSHKSGGKYIVGDYDKARDKFIVTSAGTVNTGAINNGGVHAPSAFPDGEGGVYVIYNTHAYNPIPEVDTDCMTLVYRQTIDEFDRIRFTPAGDYASLRYDPVTLKDVVLPANKEVVIDAFRGKAMEMEIEFGEDTQSFEINVLRSPLKEEYTTITFYRDKGFSDRTKEGDASIRDRYSVIEVDNAHGSLSPNVTAREPDIKHVPMPADGSLKLHIFIDQSIVEVFANDFTVSMVRTWPIREDSDLVSFRAFGKDVKIKQLDAWKMKGIL